MVFHDEGYTVYEPSRCHLEHQVTSDFSNFKSLPEYGPTSTQLCGGEEGDQKRALCSWGQAVNVRNKFIYISQPTLNRVVVIEIQDRSNPVEVSSAMLAWPDRGTYCCVHTKDNVNKDLVHCIMRDRGLSVVTIQ